MSHRPAIDRNNTQGRREHGAGWNSANRKNWATADLNNVLNRLPSVADQLVNAIDNEDENGFKNACTGAGLSSNLAQRVWDATMGSIDPQSARPCW